ncbi:MULTISPECIES: gp53-like domain-containing protein [Pseudomonas]|uniref:gp53-like domain-containing protein n=1 Tax=Pseudomonas TaxID=286 RepID=UPI001F37F19F|nr:phage tail protein [Pseudomonas sputi]
MDYPNSIPSAGLVNGRFVDEDLITGKPGSLIPASWGNGVTQELLKVIQSAGLTPSESANDQLLTALRGNKLFVTPPQFDSDQSVATTEFVTRSGLQYSGFASYAASVALSAANVGGVASFSSATAISTTLPATSNIAHGSTLQVINAGTGVLTIETVGSDVIKAANGAGGPIGLGLGDSAEFIKLDNQWRLIGGTMSNRYSSLLSGVSGSSGYQRHASGNIDQWGMAVSDANGDIKVVFPISFPNAFSSIVAIHSGGDGAMVILTGSPAPSKQGCTLKIRSYNGGVASNWTVLYHAKGY